MRASRFLTAATAVAVTAAVAVAPANAATTTPRPSPDFEPGTQGSSPTGSSTLDTAGIAVGVALLIKLVADNVPPLRKAIDDAAAQLGIQTSSQLDLSVEHFLRSIGQVEVADQIAALSSQSN